MLILLAFSTLRLKIKSVKPCSACVCYSHLSATWYLTTKIANPANIILSAERYRESANWSTGTTPGRQRPSMFCQPVFKNKRRRVPSNFVSLPKRLRVSSSSCTAMALAKLCGNTVTIRKTFPLILTRSESINI